MPRLGIRFCRVCKQNESDIELAVPEFRSEKRERRKAERKSKLPRPDTNDMFAVHEHACEAARHSLSVSTRAGSGLTARDPSPGAKRPRDEPSFA